MVHREGVSETPGRDRGAEAAGEVHAEAPLNARSDRDLLGLRGEETAAAYFVSKGYAVIDRRWRCRFGEIDLVLRRGDGVVFVEVKTRRSGTYGPPREAVTARKRSRLRASAFSWLERKRLWHLPYRIDVLCVTVRPDGRAAIEHVRDAVGEDDGP